MPYRPYRPTTFARPGARAVASRTYNTQQRQLAFSALRATGRPRFVGFPPSQFRQGFGAPPPELKVIDTAQAVYPCDTTGSVTLVNGIAIGDDFNNRDGRQITLKSVLIQGFVGPTDASTGVNLARVMLVWDSQPNASLAAIADIFNAATATSPLNLTNRDRFRVVMDKWFAHGPFDTTATMAVADRTVSLCKKYKKLNNTVTFGNTGATIASIQTGALLLVTIGTNAVNAGASLTCSVRVRFTE